MAVASIGGALRRDARRAGALPGDDTNESDRPSMEDVSRAIPFVVPFIGPVIRGIQGLAGLAGFDDLGTSDPGAPRQEGGRARRRLFRPVEEERTGGPRAGGEADLSNVGERGRRRRRLLGTPDQPPTTRRQLLGI